MDEEKKKSGYQSKWSDQINDIANKILNREKFTYDLNGDALYKQYKDRYTQQGKQAMMDTMGQAQAMTGGYGNSYAQSVGQQTYQGYMQQLNDQVPTLYQLALDKYNSDGNQMRDNLSLMMQQDDIDYGRYRDQKADQEAAYEKLIALMTSYGYKPTPEEMEAAGMTTEQMNAILKKLKRRSSGSGGGGTGGGKYDPARIKWVQQNLNKMGWNVPEDGVFGEETKKAYYEYVRMKREADKGQSVPTAADLWGGK